MTVEHTLSFSDYLGQDKFYFSESRGEAISLDKMPYPHLVFSMKKLLREHPECVESKLFQAMLLRACPSSSRMTSLFSNRVSVGYWLGAPGAKTRKQVRGMAIIAANNFGFLLKFERKDDILYITPEPVPQITLRKK